MMDKFDVFSHNIYWKIFNYSANLGVNISLNTCIPQIILCMWAQQQILLSFV